MKKKLFFVLFLLTLSLCARTQIITTIAGGGTNGLGDGALADSARLYNPSDVATDTAGNIYIADAGNNRIRKVSTSGLITTIAGVGGADGYNGDGIAATIAKLAYPSGIALDNSGNIYICDDHNYRIRMINTSGIITTIAGTGTSGYNGDNIVATSAQIASSIGIAVNFNGDIFIGDAQNNRIRKISPAIGGIITTIAGTGTAGYSGNGGPATACEISDPIGVATDGTGNIYFAEYGNSCIRKVSVAGIVSTIAGNGTSGFSGDGLPATLAQLDFPSGVEVDNLNNVYIADVYNNRIRKVSASGIISTIAGVGGSNGYSGDNGPATLAELNTPDGVTIDNAGNLYIADWGNNRIRLIKSTLSAKTILGDPISLTIYPNPAPDGRFVIKVSSSMTEQVNIEVTNLLGEIVSNILADSNNPIEVRLDVPAGIYMVSLNNRQSFSSAKIIVK